MVVHLLMRWGRKEAKQILKGHMKHDAVPFHTTKTGKKYVKDDKANQDWG